MAGCTTGPFGNPAEQEGTVTLIINNSANETHNLDIRVVEPSASLTIHYRDGAVVKSEVGQGLSNHDTGPRTVTKIDFPESARVQGQYTLEPDEENKSSIKNAFSDSVLVVVVSNSDGEIFSWVSANCDEQDLVGLEVTSYPTPPGGVFASYECR
jgi:hypothetical protein